MANAPISIPYADLTSKVIAKKRGQLGTIVFYSAKETTTKGEYVYKMTKTQFHKVDYKNTKDYIPPKSTTSRKNNFTYLVEDQIKEHNNTHNVLLNVIPFKSKVHKVSYFNLNWEKISKAEAMAKMVPEKNDNPKYYTVKVAHIVSYK